MHTHLLIILSSQVFSHTEESIECRTATANVVPGIVHGKKHSARTQQTLLLANLEFCMWLNNYALMIQCTHSPAHMYKQEYIWDKVSTSVRLSCHFFFFFGISVFSVKLTMDYKFYSRECVYNVHVHQ